MAKIKIILLELIENFYNFIVSLLFIIAPSYIYLLSKKKFTVPKAHRWKKNTNPEDVLNGNIDQFIEANLFNL